MGNFEKTRVLSNSLNERNNVINYLLSIGYENYGRNGEFLDININHKRKYFMTTVKGDVWPSSEILQYIDFIYPKSNRFKLKQAIKETGISSRKLSHFAMGNESFFYNQTGPARFKEYGDISSSKLEELIYMVGVAKKRLNAKIEQDAFDEREKLDLAAKTVDENNMPVGDGISDDTNAIQNILNGNSISVKKFKPEDVKITIGDTEIKGTLSEFDELFSKSEKDIGNSEHEDIKRFVDQPQSQAIEKRDYRLRNWLIALIIFALLLAFYFFQK